MRKRRKPTAELSRLQESVQQIEQIAGSLKEHLHSRPIRAKVSLVSLLGRLHKVSKHQQSQEQFNRLAFALFERCALNLSMDEGENNTLTINATIDLEALRDAILIVPPPIVLDNTQTKEEV